MPLESRSTLRPNRDASALRLRGAAAVIVIMLGVSATTAIVLRPGLEAGAGVVALFVLAGLACLLSPRLALQFAIIAGLSAGLVRRVLDYGLGDSPLTGAIVVLPALIVAALLLTNSLGRPEARLPAPVAIAIGLVVASAANPLGAGLIANLLTGALLATLMTSSLLGISGLLRPRDLVTVLVTASVANNTAVAYQLYAGLSPWDRLWVETKGYAALYIGPDLVRPLGIASSAAESSALAGVTAAVAIYAWRRSKNYWMLGFAAWCGFTCLTTGTRTFFILMLIAGSIALIVTARKKGRVLVGVIIAVPVSVVLTSVLIVDNSTGGASRTLTTLSGNEDLSSSTIPLHADIATNALLRGIQSVVGSGPGQLGILTSSGLGSAETDFANIALMAGIPGLVVLLYLWARSFRTARSLATGRRSNLSTVILVATFTQWFNPGYYGVTLVVWIALGMHYRNMDDTNG